MCEGSACGTAHMWRSEDNFQEAVLFFPHVGFRNWTQEKAWRQVPLPTEPCHGPLWRFAEGKGFFTTQQSWFSQPSFCWDCRRWPAVVHFLNKIKNVIILNILLVFLRMSIFSYFYASFGSGAVSCCVVCFCDCILLCSLGSLPPAIASWSCGPQLDILNV